jgi:hypothetical protein
MAFIGTPLDTRNTFQSLQGKRFNGDGSTTDFTLDVAPSSTLDIEVFVGNVRQDPNSAYTLSGTTLAFTGAPASGTNNIYVVHQAKSVGTIDPPATETIAKTFSGGVTLSGTTTHSGALNVTGGLDLGDGNITDVGTIAADRVLGDADSDSYIDFPGSDIVTINTGDNIRFRVDASGILSTGGETAPDTTKGGICLNQAQFDAKILTFKSSDIAHGNTGAAEADTYGFFDKYHATLGGLMLEGFSENSESGLHLKAYSTGAANTGESTSQYGVMEFNAVINSGTGTTTPAGDGNAFTFECDGDVEFIIKGDGELFSNQSATVGTYDTYEDAQLIRAYDLNRGENVKGLINSKFDKFVQYNKKDLADAKLIGKDKNGNPTSFVNITGMQRLHNGAIWQQYEKHNQLLEAVYDLAKEAVGKEKANAILDKHEVKRLQ